MRTIGHVLDENRGIGPGFDFLRIALAVSVLLGHSFLIAQGERHQYEFPPMDQIHASILPMFFALSGSLITGSALRLNLKDFILNRAIRIVPALAMDIVFAALIIGPLYTTISLGDYLSSYEFRAYFLNTLGLIHYTLPGVFEQNPFPATVNGSLWTVPFEIGCYVIMALLIITGTLRRPSLLLILSVLLALLLLVSVAANWVQFGGHGALYNATNHFVKPEGRKLYIYFLAGILFYAFRHKIPFSKISLAVALLIFFAFAFRFLNFAPEQLRQGILIPVVAYITVFIGVSPIPKIPLYNRGDYSYGIYLYGYPFQQALVSSFPQLTSPWLHFGISLILVTLVAMCSWHFIEKPALGLRKKFSFTARKGDPVEALPTPPIMSRSDEAASGLALISAKSAGQRTMD